MGLDELKKKLDRDEAKTHGGAPSRSPKQKLLDLKEVQEKHPDKRVRFIQTGNPERARTRIEGDGYEVLPPSEGGRTVGGLSIGVISREKYDARVAEQQAENQRRLHAHEREVEAMAESVARELRDRHGVNVEAKDLMVNE
jgi:hypothetical protein